KAASARFTWSKNDNGSSEGVPGAARRRASADTRGHSVPGGRSGAPPIRQPPTRASSPASGCCATRRMEGSDPSKTAWTTTSGVPCSRAVIQMASTTRLSILAYPYPSNLFRQTTPPRCGAAEQHIAPSDREQPVIHRLSFGLDGSLPEQSLHHLAAAWVK